MDSNFSLIIECCFGFDKVLGDSMVVKGENNYICERIACVAKKGVYV